VWFLAGAFPGGPSLITRTCTIPSGKALFFSPLNGVFGELGPGPVSDCPNGPDDCPIQKIRALAAANVDNPEALEATIDGVRVKNLIEYRVASPVFSAFFPDGAIFDIPKGVHHPLVSDGYWLLLAPLSHGKHTIHFNGVASGGAFGLGITYHLDVTK
jgi:hypothetical protein